MALLIHVPRKFDATSWGGTESVLEQTLPELTQAGFQQRVFTSNIGNVPLRRSVGGIQIERFPHLYPEWPLSAERRRDYDAKGGPLVSFALSRAIERAAGLRLVHCHTGGRLGAQALAAARKQGARCVLTLHGGHFDIPAAERASFEAKVSSAGRFRVPYGRALSWWYGARHLLDRVDAVICVGVDEYDKAVAALPRQRVRFLPGGVNLSLFGTANARAGRELLGVHDTARVISCVARVDRQKDQATLVRAWAGLPSPTVKLALVGAETSAGYASELRELAGPRASDLLLTGGVPPERVPDVMAASELCVLPSRHEPFGLSILEAWAVGRCVVAANIGGPGWLLRDERGGRLFPVGDAEMLRARLQHLLDSPEERQRLGEQGRQEVRDRFTWQARTQTLLTLYEELGVRP